MQRSELSFIKNKKTHKDRNVLLKRRDAQPCQIVVFVITPPYSPNSSSLMQLSQLDPGQWGTHSNYLGPVRCLGERVCQLITEI